MYYLYSSISITAAISISNQSYKDSLEGALVAGKLNFCYNNEIISGNSMFPHSSFKSWNPNHYVCKYYEYTVRNKALNTANVRKKCDITLFDEPIMIERQDDGSWKEVLDYSEEFL